MSFSVRNGRILPSIFMLLACLATGLFAQDNSGNIGGTILDPSGATVANARITVTNTDRNQVVRIVSTDPTGSYSIPVIPVGIYSIRVEAAGLSATYAGQLADYERAWTRFVPETVASVLISTRVENTGRDKVRNAPTATD